ncbi:uncharacterized protein PGTG_08804 [Puccinia graminis f. sp. tritici CRL 75-36-700-3]|uniref:CCHC-type domain-containing protein n=1 Tax=Puccinia graminis f. sp. tritici (strain CRL 75-36-700-3 / race SCCL) TaxID=418459 RepID=E3KE75_PUCGT|nr:uncharacterized protein PGTG_08804 [Puccinia graminis f. sp. tritici CRL 75-36-700-3]EFP82608.1 hypothetical protein PGTG_08804 [Puccinia graminis f. sp. tritici CRL 75-36-700-3]
MPPKSTSNVTVRQKSRVIAGAPRPMNGSSYSAEEIETLTPQQVAWVEENPDFWSEAEDDDSGQEEYEDVPQDGDGRFVENYPSEDSKVAVSSSTAAGRSVSLPEEPAVVHSDGMDVDSNETVKHPRRDVSYRGQTYPRVLVFAAGGDVGPPTEDRNASVAPPADFARPNVADYGPLPAQVYLTDVTKAMKGWNRDIVPNFSGTDSKEVRNWLNKLSIELAVRFVHPVIWHQVGIRCLVGKAREDYNDVMCAGRDPRSWNSFADWLIDLNPEMSNKAAVAAEYAALCMRPNETAQNFYNRFRDWQVKANIYHYSHDPCTGFVERLVPDLRLRIEDHVAAEANRQTPMDFPWIATFTMDTDRRAKMAAAEASKCFSGSRSGFPGPSGSKKEADSREGLSGKKRSDGAVQNCYNCGKPGHISAKCPHPKSKRQRQYEASAAGKSLNV